MASQGFKLSFANAKGKNLLKPSALNGQPPAKKARLLGDDEPEDNDKSVEIAGWDANAGGAIDVGGKKEEKVPLVIPSLPNRNWMGQKKGQNGAHAPPGEKDKGQNGAAPEGLPEEQMQLGLNIIRKKSPVPQNGDVQMRDADAPAASVDDGLTEEQRLEKRALEALMSGKDSAAEKHVIPAMPTEDDAFTHDYTTAPEAPSLDDYEAVPVEGFGAALLRGMGWKDGESIGRHKGQPAKQREVKRRPQGLGIGAKVEQAVDLELAQWGKPKKGKGGDVPGYVPVVLKNKITGEKITEEELKARLERQKLVADDESAEGSGRSREKEKDRRREKYDDYETEEERRERKRREREKDRDRDRDRRDRDRRRDEDYESRDSQDRRDKDRDRRDRSRDRDSRKERRRDDDYYSDRKREPRRDNLDDEARREKRRDRSRDRDRGRDNRDKRDRSRSPDSDVRRKRRRDYDDENDGRRRKYRDDEYRRK